jgi:hypothetical protein
MIEKSGSILAILTAAGILVGVGIYWGEFKRLIARHKSGGGCPGDSLLQKFANFEGKFEILMAVLTKHAAFQIRDASTPDLDLLLDKTTANRIDLDELHKLGSLLTTEINEGTKPCGAFGRRCAGNQLAASMVKARVEMMIYERTHPTERK